jgi:DNA-directed RNA polymerase specialized sigma24 family protein
MTKDELKIRLKRYLDIKDERDQIQELRDALLGPKGANLDAMPRSSGPGDPVEAARKQREDLAREYDRKDQELLAEQAYIENMIKGLDPIERKLMRHRYLEGLTWEKVCVAINYGWTQTHNMHGRILDKLVERYGEA